MTIKERKKDKKSWKERKKISENQRKKEFRTSWKKNASIKQHGTNKTTTETNFKRILNQR